MRKLRVISTKMKDGNFSTRKEDFPHLTQEEIHLLYETNLKKLGIAKDRCVILTEENKEEGYLLLKKYKIKNNTKKESVVIKSTLENFFVLAETNDDPVIIGSVTIKGETTAIVALGTLENLENEILDKMVGYLIHATGCTPFDMTFYISSCPNKENYKIEKKYLKARVLKSAIEKKKDGYYLDIRFAIMKDLYDQMVNPENVYFDSTNSVENKSAFSKLGNRIGKQLVGIVFEEEK